MTDLHDELKALFTTYIRESEKFEQEGIKVSAVRARQALNELKALIPQRRKQIQDKKMEM